MVNLEKYHHIYMIGIGGVSMSGIAEILKKWNYNVSGSDMSDSKQVKRLVESGINVNIGHKAQNITNDIDLVVYTAAVKKDNPEMIKAKELGIPTIERGEFLGEITKLFSKTIGVAGTHGKTTTTSMVACVFLEAGLDPSIQVGSFLSNIEGNYRVGNSDYFIIEACEYCDSYLSFQQESAIVLNIDDDHLDYFKNINNIIKSFRKYVEKLPSNGFLILNRDDENCFALKDYTKAKVITIGNSNNANWYYDNVMYNTDGYPSFDVYFDNVLQGKMELSVTGLHNVYNSLCCIALCHEYGISFDVIKKALVNYHGAERRLEYKGLFKNAKVYDDYGHHPTEIMATIKGIENKDFNKSWVIFEPHTFSRLAAHIKEFAKSLIAFDNIIIIDIYAAREINTFDIHEDDLINEINKLGKKAVHISDYDKIVEYLDTKVENNDLILTLGAGNVTKIADLLVKK